MRFAKGYNPYVNANERNLSVCNLNSYLILYCNIFGILIILVNEFMKKVYLETFGCQMNVSDSERVATRLVADGFEMTADEDCRRCRFDKYLFGQGKSRTQTLYESRANSQISNQ